jgi:microcystin-dependent protein
MTYQVTFTEKANPAKPPITVQDQSVNQQTSLDFVGQNYSGYAPILAGDFLHLLENFASGTSPRNPVQGQLWYDNSVSTLKIWDGTTWTSAGSLKKSATAPDVANSLQGDLWVDTANSQLYLFSGSNWLLVGPQFSKGTLTGPQVESIIDTNNVTHTVISNYATSSSTAASYRICIISKDTFTPKLVIPGFATINEGVNLSSLDASTGLTRFWGTAQSADGLLINNRIIASTNFLRSDTSSVSEYPISIRDPRGLSIGSDLSFNIGTTGSSAVLTSTNSGNSITFKLNNGGISQSVLYLDATGKIGIGINNTGVLRSTLDVNGVITADGGLTVTSTTDSTNLTTGSIQTAGGLSVKLNSNFGGNVNTYGTILVNNLVSGNPTAGAVILPGTSNAVNLYDIGSSDRPFRNVYAQSFVGSFNGSFTGSLAGSVNGSAAKLASPTEFSLTGDVISDIISFDGQTLTGSAIFNTTISSNIISGKAEALDSNFSDDLLIYRSGTGLLKITKQNLLNHVATVPVGCIMPYAGKTPPAGYLLCDGSEVPISTYTSLYSVIGFTYKAASLLQGLSTFALPDLRGRFALGQDNMNNNLTAPYKDGSGTLISAGGGAANRVSDVTADIQGAGSGNSQVTLTTSNLPDHQHTFKSANNIQYYATSFDPNAVSDRYAQNITSATSGTGAGLPATGSMISTQTANAVNIMNPYLTINYIIFTGVL